MALATAGHLDYPSAIRGKATYGIGDVTAKWSVFIPDLLSASVSCSVMKSRAL
jgi:hypothetical protein